MSVFSNIDFFRPLATCSSVCSTIVHNIRQWDFVFAHDIINADILL